MRDYPQQPAAAEEPAMTHSSTTITKAHTPIAVTFTGKSVSLILAQGGSASWRLARHRARLCEYVVCTRNTKAAWSEGPEQHGEAFLVGRVKDIAPAPSEESDVRFMFAFSEYALISIPKKWTGDRYPVHYTTLEGFGLDLDGLDWQPMPEPDPDAMPLPSEVIAGNPHADLDDGLPHDAGPGDAGLANTGPIDDDRDRPLTMAQAKRGLALTFGISPDAVEITIRG